MASGASSQRLEFSMRAEVEPSTAAGFKLFGVPLIGATPENAHKLLLTIGLVACVLALGWGLRKVIALGQGLVNWHRVLFWVRQAINLLLAVTLVFGVLSIWFDDPARLGTAAGLLSAGLAFALQKVITATAGYFVILRGRTFNLGDRIVMGGVRGDVIALSFMQTTILEMGQPPPVQSDSPAMWIRSRQYTGRIVTVSNSKVFDEPVYNYTREFPFIWDEIKLPVRYQDDRAKVEQLLVDAARAHTDGFRSRAEEFSDEMKRVYGHAMSDFEPRVYWRLTDNWLELTLRFLAPVHGVRELKDAISRDILSGLDEEGISVASATYDVVGMPTLRISADARLGAPPAS
ncbi:small-conductance mechanosensitive channel [Bradyrhizobium sp. JR1.5]|jgi:small-conductance mechanosensitive channel